MRERWGLTIAQIAAMSDDERDCLDMEDYFRWIAWLKRQARRQRCGFPAIDAPFTRRPVVPCHTYERPRATWINKHLAKHAPTKSDLAHVRRDQPVNVG